LPAPAQYILVRPKQLADGALAAEQIADFWPLRDKSLRAGNIAPSCTI
jgi:hypothetical protein